MSVLVSLSNEASSLDVTLYDDAAEYVESIMPSQHAVRVNTPATRKRNRSAPSPTLSSMVKKARSSDASPSSPDSGASSKDPNSRRELYTETPTPVPRRKVCRPRSDNVTEVSMESLIDRLSTDISDKFSQLNDRIDRLEQGLEQRIANKVAQILDKRINTELKRLRKDVDAHVESVTDSIKAEVAADIADINKKIDSVSNAGSTSDLSCNVIVRNLPEHDNENTHDKVSSLFREGCGVREVTFESAERKKGPHGKPGVVVVKFKNVADKKKIMENKRKLKHSRRFQNVYIQHDQSRTDRLIADNFRTMLSAIKSGNHNLSVKGARVIRSDNRSLDSTRQTDRDSRQNSERPRYIARHSNRNNGHQSRR